MIYCVVPRELAAKLHEPLRRHFRDDRWVEVVVERRAADRRQEESRRRVEAEPPNGQERRQIHNREGRRVGERRAPLIPVEMPPLPRKARPYAERLMFLERLAHPSEHDEDLDTARLVTRIQAGDREGYAELYMRYFDRVYGYLRMLLRDSHEAEDVAQQVFLRVLEALPKYERRRQPFRAWLFTIVRNQALTNLSKRQRMQVVEPEEIDRRRESAGEREQLSRVLEWIADRELLLFIERLPLAQRQVLVMRFMLDLNSTEIAEMIDSTPEAVRALQARAMRSLRARLTSVGKIPERGDIAPTRRGVRQAPVLRNRRFALRPRAGRQAA
jgi:RNA polymerase sigma-70 factor (ECF subfamily)